VNDIHWVELIVFAVLFGLVTVLGFMAARWKAGDTLDHLDEWGLGGRKFGSWITWFLIGGDLYTAYTFVAVPALLFSAGATGFFALPYTIIAYPIVFLPLLRLWSVSRSHGYVTPADFVRGRYGSPILAFLIAITGIVATMPYIALQLVGLESVLRTLGFNASGILGHLPLLIAFIILAVYTYKSGLRAPALIAFVKDILIYIVIIVAVIYLPSLFSGGWSEIFSLADKKFDATPVASDGILLNANNQLQYATLAFGSALALFLYPHSVTGVLASRGRKVIKRNMSALPAYSLLLGLLALLGYIAIAAGTKAVTNNATGRPDTNTIIPQLFQDKFSPVFTGIAFAAIGIGALVPAAIMSIAAANLWTRNIYKEYIKKDATPAQQAKQAKLSSLVVKFGAVAFILFIDPQFSIDLQLIGGVMILQTLPAVAIALYTRWLHIWGLVAGWVVGMGWGMYLLYTIPNPATGKAHFGTSALSLDKLSLFGWHPFAGSTVLIYVGILSLVANLVVAVIVTFVARRMKVSNGLDETNGTDYHVDEDDKDLREIGVH
jgi:SSS family solute:Na+ symporter